MMTPGNAPHFVNRPKLLVVDDQPVNIRVLNELFRNDCDVFMATSGEQAITLCQQHLPDLILLDVVMPGIDGYEVCRRLKTSALTQDIPIIFITAEHDEAHEVQGLELGAVDFISKPIHPTIVRARVKTHLTLKYQSDTLRAIAMLDGLTGLANRRKFDEDLELQLRHCQREKLPLSLILLDVDYFKRYNDCYGHVAGDVCLKLVAQALHNTLNRPHDTVARYGGEEFSCILPNTTAVGAAHVAEAILKNIRALNIEHEKSDIEKFVTVSIGVVTVIPREEMNVGDLIVLADQQLYEAKTAGRARVCSVEMP